MGLFSRVFGPPSRERFARALMKEIRRQGETRPLTFDSEAFAVIRGDDQANLGNVYQEHCGLAASERRQHLRRLARTFFGRAETPDRFEDVRPNLRPKIWSRSPFEAMALQREVSGKDSLDTPLYPLGAHLCSSIVIDLADSMQAVASSQLEQWGVTYYEAMESALHNLNEATIGHATIGDGLYGMITGDNYDSSRILLLDCIRSFELHGDPVAIVPQRDQMFVTGSDDTAGLVRLADLAAHFFADQYRPLSPLPLRLVDGEWGDWMPAADHPASPKFAMLRRKFFGELYSEQKPLLDALYEKRGEDVFVATFFLFTPKDNTETFSCSLWMQGVEALLPDSEYVAFMQDESTAVASGTMQDVRRVVGDLIQTEEDLYPLRHRVRRFPSREQLAAIGDALGFVQSGP